MNDKEVYLVSEKDLRELLECQARLDALEYGGVDNWQWYSESNRDYLKAFNCRTFEELVKNRLKKYKKYEG